MWLAFSKAEKRGAVHAAGREFTEVLHEHPSGGRANRDKEATHVLSERHAAMVLGGAVLRPYCCGGPVQAAVGYVEGMYGDRRKFLNAAWVRWEVLDGLQIEGLGGARCKDVFTAVGKLVEGGSAAGKSDTAQQGHAGPYREFGLGILTGRGRPGVRIGTPEMTVGAAQPFFLAGSKRTEASDGRRTGGDEEECLARALAIVSAALQVASPSLHAELREHGFGAAPVLSKEVQYPRLRRETRDMSSVMLPCHQMAVRSTKVGGGSDTRSTTTRTGRSSTESEQRLSVLSGSDVHVDVMDGGGDNGSVAAFACLPLQEGDCGLSDEDQQPAPDKDLAVFATAPNSKKNRYYGLRAQTMHPAYLCLLTMPTSTSPHGSVFPEDVNDYVAKNMPRPGYRYVRLLTYTMRGIESFVSKVGDSELVIRDAASQVGDARVKSMLLGAADRLGVS